METIEEIVERATVAQDRNGPAFHTLSLSKLKATNHPMGERTAWQAAAADRGNSISSLKQKGSPSHQSGEHKVESPFHWSKDRLISDLGGPRWTEANGEEGYKGAAKSKLTDMNPGISSPQFARSISAVTENKGVTVRHSLPAYLVDQVGRQLARSVMRGDRVIKIRLNPLS